MNSKKQVSVVVIEAIVVGLALLFLIYLLSMLLGLMSLRIEKFTYNQYILIFISGALFHLLFEYTGLNIQYALDYCKL